MEFDVKGDVGYPAAYPKWYKNIIDSELKYIIKWQLQSAYPINSEICSYEVNFNNWEREEFEFFQDNICNNAEVKLDSNMDTSNDIQAMNLINSTGIVLSSEGPFDKSMQFITRCAEPQMFTFYILPISMILWMCHHKYKYRNSAIHESSKNLTHGVFCFVKLCFGFYVQDFVTQAVKLIVRGDRPYWIYPRFLRQFSMTCETGGGFPSGHQGSASYIIHAALGFLILHLINLNPNESRLTQQLHRWKVPIIASTVILSEVVLAIVALSRVYTSSHFLHQTFVGWAIGLLLATLVHVSLTYRRFQIFMRQAKKRNIIMAICAVAGSFSSCLLLLNAAVLNYSARGTAYTLFRATAGCRTVDGKILTSKFIAVLLFGFIFVICYNAIPILFMHKDFHEDRLMNIEEQRIRTLPTSQKFEIDSEGVPLRKSSKSRSITKAVARVILYCIGWLSSMQVVLMISKAVSSPEITLMIRGLYTGIVPWCLVLWMP